MAGARPRGADQRLLDGEDCTLAGSPRPGRAPPADVVPRPDSFDLTPRQHYQDPLSRIVGDQDNHDMTAAIFGPQRNLHRHALLSPEHAARRLTFFNNATLKVTRFHLTPSGKAVVLLADGRAAVLSHLLEDNVHTEVDITAEAREPVRGIALDGDMVCAVLSSRVMLVRIRDRHFSFHQVRALEGPVDEVFLRWGEERWRLYVVGPQIVELWEVGRKKVVSHRTIAVGEHISQALKVHDDFFLVTPSQLLRLDPALQQSTINRWEHPPHLLSVDEFGSYTPRVLDSRGETLREI